MSSKYGILFGSLVDFTFAIIAVTVMGILVTHNSGVLLNNLVATVATDFNVTVPDTQLVNTTDQLSALVTAQNMDCSTHNSIYVMTSDTLNSLSVDSLNKTLNDTISHCTMQISTLEQKIAIVGMELTPNLPTVVQSGSCNVGLVGSGTIATTYSVNRLILGNQLAITYVLFPEWPSGIATSVSASSELKFNGFVPSLTNLGVCSVPRARAILLNRFSGINFSAYEMDCSIAGGEIRLHGPGVTAPGLLQLNQPLNLFSQFL